MLATIKLKIKDELGKLSGAQFPPSQLYNKMSTMENGSEDKPPPEGSPLPATTLPSPSSRDEPDFLGDTPSDMLSKESSPPWPLAGSVSSASSTNDMSLPLIGSTTNPQKEVATCLLRFRGIFAMLLACTLNSINPQIMYYVTHTPNLDFHYSHEIFLFYFYLIYSVINGVPVAYLSLFQLDQIINPFKEQPRLITILILRGLTGGCVLVLTWEAIDYLNGPAPVAVIIAMAPIAVYINAFFVLHETLGVVPIVNAFIACGGVVVMNLKGLREVGSTNEEKSRDSYTALTGSGIALVVMLLISWVMVFIRMLKALHPTVINLSFGIGGSLIMFLVAEFTFTFDYLHEWEFWAFCTLMAFIASISNYCFNYALKYEQAGVASLVRTSEVVFNFVYQYYLFDLKPDYLTSIGACMILFGVLCVTLRKIVLESDENSRIHKYLFFLKY